MGLQQATSQEAIAFELMMMVKSGNIPVNGQYLLAKRGIDLVLSVLLIAGVLSWLLPLLALMVIVDSRGPVLFLQRRIGMGGRIFTCIKLRTMYVNAKADEQAALENDERITRVGRILRKSHLDELPQLLNVLSGTMSLVGPRPYMPSDHHRFSEVVPDHELRHLVKPGITGLAQLRGSKGPVTDNQMIFLRWQWDTFYISHVSFFLDLRILHETLLLFFAQKISV